jgi:hypothetical protein
MPVGALGVAQPRIGLYACGTGMAPDCLRAWLSRSDASGGLTPKAENRRASHRPSVPSDQMTYSTADRWFPYNPRTIGVVDTDSLLSSIDNDCRNNRDSYLLQMSEFGTVRLYASDHVYGELHNNLPNFISPGVSLERLQSRLHQYLQLISFVTVPEDHELSRTRRVAAVTHKSDVPTAVLASVLAPCIVFSGDKHLRKPGFAPKEWRPVARSGRDVMRGDAHMLTVSFGLVGPAAGTWLAGSWTAEKLNIPTWVPFIIFAGAGAWYLSGPKRRRRLWGAVRPFVETTVDSLSKSMDAQHAGLEVLDQAAIASPQAPTLEQLVARRLATAREPLLGTELYGLLPEGSPQKLSDVMTLLRTSSLFVGEGNRWQFGRLRPLGDAVIETHGR